MEIGDHLGGDGFKSSLPQPNIQKLQEGTTKIGTGWNWNNVQGPVIGYAAPVHTVSNLEGAQLGELARMMSQNAVYSLGVLRVCFLPFSWRGAWHPRNVYQINYVEMLISSRLCTSWTCTNGMSFEIAGCAVRAVSNFTFFGSFLKKSEKTTHWIWNIN